MLPEDLEKIGYISKEIYKLRVAGTLMWILAHYSTNKPEEVEGCSHLHHKPNRHMGGVWTPMAPPDDHRIHKWLDMSYNADTVPEAAPGVDLHYLGTTADGLSPRHPEILVVAEQPTVTSIIPDTLVHKWSYIDSHGKNRPYRSSVTPSVTPSVTSQGRVTTLWYTARTRLRRVCPRPSYALRSSTVS